MHRTVLTRRSLLHRLLWVPCREFTSTTRSALSSRRNNTYEAESLSPTMEKATEGAPASDDGSPGVRIFKHLVGRASPTNDRMEPASYDFNVVSSVSELRAVRKQARVDRVVVSLVPTMGALHQGHLEIIKVAATQSDDIVVSIYVNPTQFGANEDLGTYPRTLEEDLEKLRALNVYLHKRNMGIITTVFTPTTSEMYPVGLENTSHVIMNPEITQILEGKARPTFFQGVATVVMKLLNIVQPEKAFFGQKDIQQLVILKRMVEEFHMDTTIYKVGTKRQIDGLALSSRNAYLGERRLNVAPVLIRALREIHDNYDAPKHLRRRSELLGAGLDVIKKTQDAQRALQPSKRARFELEYLSLADPTTLKEVEEVGPYGAIVSGAVVMLPLEDIQRGERLGIGGDTKPVRLIDNVLLGRLWTQNPNSRAPLFPPY